MKKSIIIICLGFIIVTRSLLFSDSTFVKGNYEDIIWTKDESPICLEGNVVLSNVIIEPGVKIVALGNYQIDVPTKLTAIGTDQELIIFTKVDSITGWQGLFFKSSDPSSILSFCRIEYALNSAVRIDTQSITIRNCIIRYNKGIDGGGIFATGTDTLEIIDTDFIGNSVEGGTFRAGGGLAVLSGVAYLENCNFIDNVAIGYIAGTSAGGGLYCGEELNMVRCTFRRNEVLSVEIANNDKYANGGGIYVAGKAKLTNCRITNNSGYADTGIFGNEIVWGAGGYFASETYLINCIFDSNYVRSTGGSHFGSGFFCTGPGTAINCVVTENKELSVWASDSLFQMINSIVFDNMPSENQVGGNLDVNYSDIEIPGAPDSTWPGIGNINRKPGLSKQPDDFAHLLSGSPCIDAGNPNQNYNDLCLPPSRGDKRNDMGAFGGPCACTWESGYCDIINSVVGYGAELPMHASLNQNYPNPFNPSTTIPFELHKPSIVRIIIYDILGREVRTLVNGQFAPGKYSEIWDGRDNLNIAVVTGIYFARMQADKYENVKKLLFVK